MKNVNCLPGPEPSKSEDQNASALAFWHPPTGKPLDPDAELQELKKQVNELYEEIQRKLKEAGLLFHQALFDAKIAGDRLIRARKLVGHGKYERWVKDNFHFSLATARAYKRVAEHWPQLERAMRCVTFESMRAVLSYLSYNGEKKPDPSAAVWAEIRKQMLSHFSYFSGWSRQDLDLLFSALMAYEFDDAFAKLVNKMEEEVGRRYVREREVESFQQRTALWAEVRGEQLLSELLEHEFTNRAKRPCHRADLPLSSRPAGREPLVPAP